MADRGKKDIKKQLTELEEAWEEAEEQESDFEEVPDGKYPVRIDSVLIENAKSSGRLQCTWTLTIADGDYRGRKLWKRDGMEDEKNLSWLRTGLARLGVDWPDKPKDLPDTVEELVGTFAEVRVRNKGDFSNVYFNQALDDEFEDLDGLDEVGDEEEGYTPAQGDEVTVNFNGDPYNGTVLEVDEENETAEVEFEDGVATIDWSDISPADEEADEEEEPDEDEEDGPPEVGDRVSVEIDGETYKGTVASAPPPGKKGHFVRIEFDDGDEDNYSVEDITVEERASAKDEEVEGVELEFTDDDLKAKHKSGINRLAKEHEFEPKDYESECDLLVDIAEYFGISGTFNDPDDLIKAIRKA